VVGAPQPPAKAPRQQLTLVLSDAVGATVADGEAIGVVVADVPRLDGPVIVAAGDIACDPGSGDFVGGQGTELACRQGATAELLAARRYDAVLTLGDNQYDKGTESGFARSYAPSWGRVRGITRPAPGNHDYGTGGAAGYFGYFAASAGDRSRGYYSYDLGTWHLLSLNSNCGDVSCDAGSAQEQWLREDLRRTRQPCILAYWHHPRWSSGAVHGSSQQVAPLYQALSDVRADVVLTGHEHHYERLAPMGPTGASDPAGIRNFVVGTGGVGHYGFAAPLAASEVRESTTFGVLRLSLGKTGYAWRFLPATGTFTDAGRGTCH
jgi:acid phosphatase type 7